MLKGKFLAGMLASYLAVFSVCFYFEFSILGHLAVAAGFFFLLCLTYFVKNRAALERKRKLVLCLVAVLLLTGAFGYSELIFAKRIAPALAFSDGNTHIVTAEVEEIRYEKAYASAYVLKLISVDETPISVGALVDFPLEGALSVGDTIAFEGIASAISGTYEYYHKSKGILLEMTAEDFSLLHIGKRAKTIFETIRTYIAKNFEAHIGGTGAGYATALLTGNREQLDDQVSLAYQRLGISHVLAVSGMHFSVVIGGLDFLLRRLTVRKRRRNILLILFALFFAGICGFSASVLRALIMFCIYYIADLIGEKSDSVTTLFFAAVCIVTANPWAVYDAGFWLSVLSTFGIILIVPSMNRCFYVKKSEKTAVFLGKKLVNGMLCMLMMNFTSIFFTMPVTYLLFGGVSLISPLANLIFIPLTELILYLLILLTLIGFVPFAAPLLGTICRFFIELADALAGALSDIRGIYLSIRYPFAIYILFALILGVLSVLFVGKFRVRRMFAVFASCFLLFAICLGVYTAASSNVSELYLQTDGKSDVLGVIDDGDVMLIDVTTGGKRVPTAAVEMLSNYYQCEIDTVLLTHLHQYHAGTLKKLAGEVKIHRVLLPEAETEKEAEYLSNIEDALADLVEILYYKRNGEEIASVGNTVLHLPDYDKINRSEHPAIVISAETDGIGAWIYCGASSMEIPAYWEKVPAYRAVIFGTHGPKVKNIFDDDMLSLAELVVFSSEETMALVNPNKITGDIAFVTEAYHIRFEY